MVTDEAFKRFHKMRIDEEKEVYYISDHNLIGVEFRVQEEERVQEEKREYKKKRGSTRKIIID